MTLKIATWNVNYENAKVGEACAFVKKLLLDDSYDFFCMQEVPHALAECLEEESSLFVSKGIDATILHNGVHEDIYHLIVSKIQPTSTKNYDGVLIPDIQKGNPFSPLLRLKHVWVHPAFYRGFMSADFDIHGERVRIFSVHPPLSSPKDREDEVSRIVKELSSDMPNFVCGDFNILETYPVKLLNWFLRLHFSQAFPGYPERKLMESRFKAAGLKNPHAGMHLQTQREARSQLDHTLVPISASVQVEKTYPVGKGFIGSDHSPVTSKVTL